MSVAATSSTNSTTGTDQTDTSTLPAQTLNQADFLQLLVAQLSNQDPMNPESDTDFAAQMAQFSALQTSQNMQQNMVGIQANSLLGQTVSLQTADDQNVTGVVSSVTYSDGTPSLVVNGTSYNMSQLLSVSLAQSQTTQTTQ
jgi:flagellar basal-body rod modification protein FlgD